MAVSVLALAAAGGVWLSRVPIATRVIDRELARRGVPARYHITDLGLGRQRLTDVVIGDPDAPDLVADWIETATEIGLAGPRVVAIRAGHVRARARWRDGTLSLGAIDRLIPTATGGGPFELPAIDVDVADARVRVDGDGGVVGLRLSGRGRLDDGFSGDVAAVAERYAVGGCTIRAARVALDVIVRRGAPTVAGPLAAQEATCEQGVRVVAPAARVRVALNPALNDWRGEVRALQAQSLAAAGARLTGLGGDVSFAGTASGTSGTGHLSSGAIVIPQARARGGLANGRFGIDRNGLALDGIVSAQGVALNPAGRRRMAGFATAGEGTPLAPLIRRAVGAASLAAGDFSVEAQVQRSSAGIAVPRVSVGATNGARLAMAGAPIRWGEVTFGGQWQLGGGGLPGIEADLRQDRSGAIGGTARVAPYAADGARLDLTPIRFDSRGLATGATLSGPLGDGRVERLTVPVAVRWRGGQVSINPDCTPVRFDALSVSGLRLGPAQFRLCPLGRALVVVANGRVVGGARLDATAVAGAIGGTPLRVASAGGTVRLATRDFALDDVRATIGAPGRETRIDATQLAGRLTPAGVVGTFRGAAGQIANVPLVMSEGAGDWALGARGLTLSGGLRVADAAAPPRFQPMAARDVTLALRDGEIAATGQLLEPTTVTRVADVAITHRLRSGAGHARLAVPGITFGDKLQPELLTRLTFGVIADVRGTVSGQGDIRWDSQGVTSTGTFTTAKTDLAAAFGPVTGIAGTIRFTDLLALESAPGQVATIASINPGVPVTDGRIVYQTLPNTRVKVESGIWPFAGGTLSLDPTLLDFGAADARRLTFHVTGMDAGKFLQQFDFENLNATGTFDGVLPMIFDANGGRIEGGRLSARPGGGGIAYLGELTEKDLGVWGNLAFQSLRSLTYRNLDIEMDGPLAGEMVTGVRFAGISQGKGARSNFLLRRLTRLPIVFNITIRAPFRGLIDSAASFYDPQRLVARNLQSLIDEQNRQTAAEPRDVQPRASDTVPPAKRD
ncbi:YdbH domain-containing protein [Sphingomonas adhaesiva]|uniref:YdbH domain-containing protein n=1 Tax=Sphingomonas adhaesiva TaxID=28212 RepID=UPI002FF8054A